MPSVSQAPPSGRYLSFVEREELTLLRAQGYGVRPIAIRLHRSPSTITRDLVPPVFSAHEPEALRPGYRYGMAQMDLAADVVFKRSAPLRAMFRRGCELGILVGGANRTTHLFGRRINRHYRGKLQTML
ncbi:MAG: helix-turn-helix domain-containing protein [Chloroflexi bacterium]|nr:helix-turn-helix domain-containing protein [Chloroflexota bacterium]